MDDWLWIVIGVAAVVVALALLAWAVSRARRRRRTARLQARFGPEYETAVHRFGRKPGEDHLEGLLREHEGRRLRDVSPHERDAILQSWQAVQTSFVEAPVVAVREADQLVFGVLRERGYPLGSLDDRASALAVDEPQLASRYRGAHAALARAEASEDGADVGSLRDALLTYRDLLEELVGAPRVPGRLTTRPEPETTRPEPETTQPDQELQEEEAWTSTPTDRT